MTPTARALRELLDKHPLATIPDVLPESAREDTAVLVPLVIEPEPSVTLVVRSSCLKHHAAEVSFPGGKREAHDPSLQATALREAQEEIGLDPTVAHVVGTLSPVPVATSRYRIHPFVACVQTRPAWRLSGEVARVLDVPLASLSAGTVAHEAVELFWAGHRILSPVFVFEDGTRLYGATAYVLVELVTAIEPLFGCRLPPPKVVGA